MLRHFKKLNSPLKCIQAYPSLETQQARFCSRGWRQATAINLWELWSDSGFLNPAQRLKLDEVEPFDEWEELALFASHYFLLHASSGSGELAIGRRHNDNQIPGSGESKDLTLLPSVRSARKAHRKHGAAIDFGKDIVGLVAGSGSVGRLASTDCFGQNHEDVDIESVAAASNIFSPRMCHTVTRVDSERVLLVGGRASPSEAFRDCWLLKDNIWSRVQDLPEGRYRHSAVRVVLNSSANGVMVFGGKKDAMKVHADSLLWTENLGWQPLEMLPSPPTSRFGAQCCRTGEQSGLFFGGMRQDGVIMKDVWTWKLIYNGSDVQGIFFDQMAELESNRSAREILCRFNSSVNMLGQIVMIIGGIAPSSCLTREHEIVCWKLPNSDGVMSDLGQVQTSAMGIPLGSSRPMFVGHDSVVVGDQEVLVLGGGAVCFSFGSFWNEEAWLIKPRIKPLVNGWSILQSSDTNKRGKIATAEPEVIDKTPANLSPAVVGSCERKYIDSSEQFDVIVASSKPYVLEGLDFGPCISKWTVDYLKKVVGPDREVIIHEASSSTMSFHAKDFKYVTRPFSTFLEMAKNGANVYLRSLSSKNKSDEPTRFDHDFPNLAEDFSIPSPLNRIENDMHSSPFRISTAGIWLHYDVQANCYFQIRGSKRLVLFPPSDILRLGFPAGTTTSARAIFNQAGEASFIDGTHPVEVELHPGDVLFIPPLWPHTAAPVQGLSVAINIFFRSLDDGYAVGRDVYGNRDLQAYEVGRKQVERIVASFKRLPAPLGRVYLQRLAEELNSKAQQL